MSGNFILEFPSIKSPILAVNAVLDAITDSLLQRLQSAQNAAAINTM